MENFNKKIGIVYDEKVKEYATYLFDLISTKENINARFVPIKEYEQTTKITSENHIIFIGSNSITENKIKYIEMMYNKYGMNYGWFGTSAVIYIEDKKLSKDDYKNFSSYASTINNKFKEENINTLERIPNVAKWIGLFCLPLILSPFLIYGLVSGSKTYKKIREQQYMTLINLFFMNGLEKFLGE